MLTSRAASWRGRLFGPGPGPAEVRTALVLLHEARNDRAAPFLARAMLWLGILARVGANVTYGVADGPLGALLSAWPAVSFIGSVKMAMVLVHQSRRPGAETDGKPPVSPHCGSGRHLRRSGGITDMPGS